MHSATSTSKVGLALLDRPRANEVTADYPGAVIDLHSHSTRSDGSETPERVVELAAEVGCTALALTDHDGLSGHAAASRAAVRLGIEFVPGCEISCAFSPGTLHVLCYFIEDRSGPLQDELERLRGDRETRNTLLIERLQALDLPITAEEVAARAGDGVTGRPHFASVLMDKGIVSSIDEAFTRYLGKGAPGYVSKARLSGTDVIALAQASGGVTVIAHPLSLGLEGEELDRELGNLAAAGLGGLECLYGRYDPPTRKRLVELARRHRLVPTGGSDFHGSYKPDMRLGIGTGDLHVGEEVLVELRARVAA